MNEQEQKQKVAEILKRANHEVRDAGIDFKIWMDAIKFMANDPYYDELYR